MHRELEKTLISSASAVRRGSSHLRGSMPVTQIPASASQQKGEMSKFLLNFIIFLYYKWFVKWHHNNITITYSVFHKNRPKLRKKMALKIVQKDGNFLFALCCANVLIFVISGDRE